MKNDETTTIAVYPATKARLERLKVHPNQSFDEILNEVLDKLK